MRIAAVSKLCPSSWTWPPTIYLHWSLYDAAAKAVSLEVSQVPSVFCVNTQRPHLSRSFKDTTPRYSRLSHCARSLHSRLCLPSCSFNTPGSILAPGLCTCSVLFPDHQFPHSSLPALLKATLLGFFVLTQGNAYWLIIERGERREKERERNINVRNIDWWLLICSLTRHRIHSPGVCLTRGRHPTNWATPARMLTQRFLIFLRSTSHHGTFDVFYIHVVFMVWVPPQPQRVPHEHRFLSDESPAPRTVPHTQQTLLSSRPMEGMNEWVNEFH